MKQLELQLQKKLLIVEIELCCGQSPATVFFQLNRFDLDLICKGSELTEEIAKELVENLYSEDESSIMYKDYKSANDNEVVYGALDSFNSAVEDKGYYWGENPFGREEPEIIEDLGVGTIDLFVENENWKEAESQTFKPKQTYIFEIIS